MAQELATLDIRTPIEEEENRLEEEDGRMIHKCLEASMNNRKSRKSYEVFSPMDAIRCQLVFSSIFGSGAEKCPSRPTIEKGNSFY
jgi:hypothetical protein